MKKKIDALGMARNCGEIACRPLAKAVCGNIRVVRMKGVAAYERNMYGQPHGDYDGCLRRSEAKAIRIAQLSKETSM